MKLKFKNQDFQEAYPVLVGQVFTLARSVII